MSWPQCQHRPHDTSRRRAHPGQRPWRAFVSHPCGRTPARQCFALWEVKQPDVELEAKKKAKEKTDKENANIIPDKAANFFGKDELVEMKREVEALKSENETLKVFCYRLSFI